ncbi:MAG TPA: hypothetical protein VFO77_10110, partial [Actinoplanes sp.]|nr:hypothetical protein [Actinoplanes sp.]
VEDRDHDGRNNEDEDDHDGDACNGDRDHDGERDEDEGDRFGTIDSFDSETGALVVTTQAGDEVSVTVTEDTEIEVHDSDDEEGDIALLVAGTGVAEIELECGTDLVKEIELL